MPISISPTIASVGINGNTYDHIDWENNTPGTISGIANDISSQITLLELVGILTKAISGNVTLSGPESTNIGFVFIGALGANANITFAAGFEGVAQIENQTTGGFSLVCGLAAGTAVTVPPLGSAAAFCDGSNFTLASGVVRTSTGASVTGTLAVSGAVTIGGAVSVGGAVTVSGAMSVTGALATNTTVNIGGAATVGGALSVGGAIIGATTLNVTGAAGVGGALAVAGVITGDTTMQIAGNATVGGAQTVVGAMSVGDGTSGTPISMDSEFYLYTDGISVYINTNVNSYIQYNRTTNVYSFVADGVVVGTFP